MSDGINQVFLMGNLGGDAELRTSEKGSVLKMNLATTESWLDKDNVKQERTEWHTVKVFGRRGEALAKHLRKGTKLFVQGRIQYGSYEKDGQKRYTTDVVAQEISFAGGPSNGAFVSKGSDPKPQSLPF
ncbi:MAG: single-stranded DNA-binding protein [Labilithrix sp.]|nr:single-stranded DNA-binding protein [Labilithrix sp.]MCW5815969.1 single-stranded DNA-binding protein [Labilithrix sp.]